MKQQEAEENCIMRTFVIYTLPSTVTYLLTYSLHGAGYYLKN
jgi:hypothetical protein